MRIQVGSRRTLVLYSVTIVLTFGASGYASAADRSVLTLAEAERLALEQDPVTQSFQARAMGFAEQAIADGQLPDPQLKLGIVNLPVDSFSRSRDDMTMLEFGLQQRFPPGRTLHYRRERGEALSDAERMRSEARRLELKREVRLRYLDVYYRDQALKLLRENQTVFERLVEITERQYAAGRDNQQDILRAQLELTLIEDRILEILRAREAEFAELGRYISARHVGRPLVDAFPELPKLHSMPEIEATLAQHPLLLMEDAGITAADKQVAEAEQLYMPGFMLDVSYGARSGRMVDGDARSDMLTAMLSVELPIFTNKRQDRRLAAAQLQRQSAQYARTDRWRGLDSTMRREYVNWRRLADRIELYEQRALVDARMNAEVTLKAYQNDVTDFSTLIRAQLSEIETQLDLLRLQVEQAQVQARLLYLQGEMS
jgi:outer membrane protein TolC